MRTVRFFPYRKGEGPIFTLKLYSLGQSDNHLGYKLTMKEHRVTTLLFEGEDFRCSPLHAQDSDDCIKSLMTFLTLRPGDTDAEYFARYTKIQRDYCAQHAEYLSFEVYRRFGG
jgi:hypothetical protein